MPERMPRWLWRVGCVALVGGIVYALRGVLTPICLAFAIAYLLDPLVDRFEARGTPRGLAVAIVFALVVSAGGLVLLIVVPGVVREVAHVAGELPAELEGLRRRVEPWLLARGIAIPHDLDEALRQLPIAGGDLAGHLAAVVQSLVRSVLGGTLSAIGLMASALVVPVLACYLLYDFDRIVAAARDLVPPRIRPSVVEVATEIDEVLGQFVRGQLCVMLAMAILYALAYSLVGIRLAVPIGLVAGLLTFIPYVGGGFALTMGLLMALIDWQGWIRLLGVVVAYAICQGLEGFVLVPKLVGDKVGLPAVWVLVALMVGGEIFGFLGVLLALPAAAVIKIFVVRGLRWYRQSALFVEAAGVARVTEVAARTGDRKPHDADAAGRGFAPEPDGSADGVGSRMRDMRMRGLQVEPEAEAAGEATREVAAAAQTPPAASVTSGHERVGEAASDGASGRDVTGDPVCLVASENDERKA
jgi:predicted PurR-regulated permease PerM